MPNLWPVVGSCHRDGGEAAAENTKRGRDEEVRARSPRAARSLQALLERPQGAEVQGLDGQVCEIFFSNF